MSQSLRTYWARVYARKEDGKGATWPTMVEGWESGSDPDGRSVWCLMIHAESEDAARAEVEACWSEYEIDSIDEKPTDWRPPTGRFPARKAAKR
jgi:hypothetical protein